MTVSDTQSKINDLATRFNKQQITMEEYDTELAALREELAAESAAARTVGEPSDLPAPGVPGIPPDALAQQAEDARLAAAEGEAVPPAPAPDGDGAGSGEVTMAGGGTGQETPPETLPGA